MTKQAVIGVDLGGTTIKVGLCRPNGELLRKWEGATDAHEGADRIIANIVDYASQLLVQHGWGWDEIAGVGLGVAGFVDAQKGWVSSSPNLGIKDVAIRDQLQQKVNVPVMIDNDTNTAALGEASMGAGQGKKHVVCYTLGTGVGGGIVANGRIYQGGGYAGEFGHMRVVPDLEAVSCRCGQTGCLETVASATGIRRMAMEAMERGEQGELTLIENISTKDVFDAARNGDEVALRIVKRATYYLAKSMALATVILDPERFIIGGGVSLAGDVLFEPLRQFYEKDVLQQFKGKADIQPAKLGNEAGMIGSALLVSGLI